MAAGSGGIGAAPKHPSQRRRTNEPARGEWIEISQPRLDEPALPPLKEIVGTIGLAVFSKKARKLWAAWRYEPVTTYWSDSDIKYALQTLELYDDYGQWKRSAAEIRLRETSLALNPKGKRDLRFKIMFGIGKEATKDKPPPSDENVVNIDSRRSSLGHGA